MGKLRVSAVVVLILLLACLAGCSGSSKNVKIQVVNSTMKPYHFMLDNEKFSQDNKVLEGGKRALSKDFPEKNNEMIISFKISAGQNGQVSKSKEFNEKVTYKEGNEIILTWNGTDFSFQYKKP